MFGPSKGEELQRLPDWDTGAHPQSWIKDRKSMAMEAAVTRKVTTTLAVLRSNTETPREAMKADERRATTGKKQEAH